MLLAQQPAILVYYTFFQSNFLQKRYGYVENAKYIRLRRTFRPAFYSIVSPTAERFRGETKKRKFGALDYSLLWVS